MVRRFTALSFHIYRLEISVPRQIFEVFYSSYFGLEVVYLILFLFKKSLLKHDQKYSFAIGYLISLRQKEMTNRKAESSVINEVLA